MSGGTQVVELNAISATDTGGLDIPSDTWEDMVSAAQDREFTYAYDSDGLWSFSNVTGIIERSEVAQYVAYASVDWQSVATGDIVGVAVQFGSAAYWYRNVQAASAGGSGMRTSVVGAPGIIDLSAGTGQVVRAFVYANPAATITRAELIVRRFELQSAGTEYSF